MQRGEEGLLLRRIVHFPVHVGINSTWKDGIHANVLRTELGSKRLFQTDEPDLLAE